jgi:hypothetical protein
MINVKQTMERGLAGEIEVLGENLPQCHLCAPQISYDLTSNLGRRGGKPETNRLSYDTALERLLI